MTAADLVVWRKYQGWSQREAALALGMSTRAYQDHEAGQRGGKVRTIPRYLDFACRWLDDNPIAADTSS